MKLFIVLTILIALLAGSTKAFQKHENSRVYLSQKIAKLHQGIDMSCYSRDVQAHIDLVAPENHQYLKQQLNSFYQQASEHQLKHKSLLNKVYDLCSDVKTGKFWQNTFMKMQVCSSQNRFLSANDTEIIIKVTIAQKIHNQEIPEDFDEQCFNKKANTCTEGVSEDEQAKIEQQLDELNEVENGDDPDALQAKIQELEGDEETGSFWTCFFDAMRSCINGDEENLLTKIQHKQEVPEDFDEKCFNKKANTCTEDVSEDEQAKIESQLDELDEVENGDDPDALQAKIQELEGDEETGSFWTCYFDAMRSCINGDEETLLKKQHIQEIPEDFDEKCFNKKANTCTEDVSEDEQAKIEQQLDELDEVENGDDPDALQAKIQELEGDEETGSFWTCYFDAMRSCINGGDEAFIVQSTRKFTHNQVSEACISEEFQTCSDKVDPSDADYLQSQFQDLQDKSESGASQEEVENYAESLANDSRTGDFWECFFSGLQECD